jgi:Flp pilus assembly protein TadG
VNLTRGHTTGRRPAETTSDRCVGDSGQIGGIEVLPFGFLVFVGATLLFANVWGVLDAKFAVTAAAREAARAFVESDTEETARRVAHQRATETLAAYGRSGARSAIEAPVLDAPFARCSRVTVRVSYTVPAITIPFIGGFGALAPVESTHTELVDPFRNGLAGPASC